MGTKPRRRRVKPQAAQASPFSPELTKSIEENARKGQEILGAYVKTTELSEAGERFMAAEIRDRVSVTSMALPIFPGEIFKTPEPEKFPNWKLHLVIFLAALAIGCLIGFSLATRAHGAASEAPRIGRLTLPAPWWEIVKQAAQENDLDPCWVVAVMAIESRFHRYEVNVKHRCYGLMQLQKDVCRTMGVTDPFDPEQNIRAGAKILARLQRECGGNKLRILKKYNPTDTGAYSREVMKAWKQARSGQ